MSVTSGSGSIVKCANGWYRVSVTGTSASPNSIIYIYPDTTVSTTNSILVWGAQTEALPFASSYIPTLGVAATRVLDKLSIPFAGNAPRIGLSYKNPMTVVFDVDLHKWNSVNQTLISSSLNYDYLFRQFGNAIYMYYGQNMVTLPTVSSSTGTHRLAVSLSADKTSIFGYLDGVSGALGSSSSDSTGTPSNIFLGNQSNIYSMFGHIRNFRIYDRALTPREIQAS